MTNRIPSQKMKQNSTKLCWACPHSATAWLSPIGHKGFLCSKCVCQVVRDISCSLSGKKWHHKLPAYAFYYPQEVVGCINYWSLVGLVSCFLSGSLTNPYLLPLIVENFPKYFLWSGRIHLYVALSVCWLVHCVKFHPVNWPIEDHLMDRQSAILKAII